jgi:hypothetical protein
MTVCTHCRVQDDSVYTGGILANASMLSSGVFATPGYSLGTAYIWAADTNSTVVYKIDSQGILCRQIDRLITASGTDRQADRQKKDT